MCVCIIEKHWHLPATTHHITKQSFCSKEATRKKSQRVHILNSNNKVFLFFLVVSMRICMAIYAEGYVFVIWLNLAANFQMNSFNISTSFVHWNLNSLRESGCVFLFLIISVNLHVCTVCVCVCVVFFSSGYFVYAHRREEKNTSQWEKYTHKVNIPCKIVL